MEFIVDDSPLGQYLQDTANANNDHMSSGRKSISNKRDSAISEVGSWSEQSKTSFAPQGRPALSRRTTEPQEQEGPSLIQVIRNVCAYAVSSTLGKEDNHRFLEHFRYVVIASQLLVDTTASSNHRLSSSFPISPSFPPQPASSTFISNASFGPGGILLAAVAASPILYILRSIRNGGSTGISWIAISLLCCAIAMVGSLLYAYARRQWLKSLRRQAVLAASAFVAAMQDYETTAASLLTFVQEVELVSKGYRLSNPLPPVSRLEGNGQHRTCARMRRTLQSVYSTISPNFVSASEDLEPHIQGEDFDRYLEVYDVRKDDIDDAQVGFVDVAQEELESLRCLKLYQYRLATLRRVLLCSLLSIPATGRQADALRWRVAVAVTEYLTQLLVDSTAILAKLQQDEQKLQPVGRTSRPQSMTMTSRPTSLSSAAGTSTSPQATAIRPISNLTTGVHTLSARLHLLRSSVTTPSPSTTTNSSPRPLSSSVQEQYDLLGDDLKALMREWETGRDLLSLSSSSSDNTTSTSTTTTRPDLRRISSNRMSASGLGVLLEDDHDADMDASTARATALRALTGEGIKRSSTPLPLHLNHLPLSPPVSIVDGGSDTSTPADEREAIFEGVAVPRARQRSSLSGMSREQRIAKMQEEQARIKAMRRSRDVQGEMMGELKSVIGQRGGGGGGGLGRPLSFRAQRESVGRERVPS